MQHFFRNVSWLSKYDIAFKGLAEGQHEFDYQIDDKFFEHFEGSLVDNGNVTVKVILEKRSAFLKLHLKIKGWLELTCDRCLENYQQKIKNSAEIFVKFGEKEFEEGENVIWVLPEENQLNVAQIIYEYVSLSIPLRHIHPKDENGHRDCNIEMVEKLKKYTHSAKEVKAPTDPRWNALKNLDNNN